MKMSRNELYSRRECLEILGIPAEVGDKDIKEKVLEILGAIDALVNQNLVKDCHRLLSKGSPQKVINSTTKNEQNTRNYGMLSEFYLFELPMDQW